MRALYIKFIYSKTLIRNIPLIIKQELNKIYYLCIHINNIEDKTISSNQEKIGKIIKNENQLFKMINTELLNWRIDV